MKRRTLLTSLPVPLLTRTLRTLAAISIIGLGATSSGGCGAAPDSTAPDEQTAPAVEAIVNRTPVSPEHSKVVHIDMGNGFVCSGALVRNRWVLSAKHCFAGDTPVTRVNGVVLDMGSQSARASDIFVHPDAARDVALVRLDTPFEMNGLDNGFVQALDTRATANLATNLQTAMGYGCNTGGSSTTCTGDGTLRSATLSVAWVDLDGAHYELAPNTQGQGVTFGDSGGPSYSFFNTTPLLSGIHSTRDDADFSTDVAVSAVAGWVDSTITSAESEELRHFATGDFNGDGLTDWAWYAPWSNDYLVLLSNGAGGWTQVDNHFGWGDWSNGKHFSTGDFDGDGRTDFAWYAPWSNDFIVALADPNNPGHFIEHHNSTAGWGDWSGGEFFSTGDFNGDGRTDWSWYSPWSNDFIVMLSLGNGTFQQVHHSTAGWGNWSAGRWFVTGDFNGDGVTDWAWYAPWSDNLVVMRSRGQAMTQNNVFVPVNHIGIFSTTPEAVALMKFVRAGHFTRSAGVRGDDISFYDPDNNRFTVMKSDANANFTFTTTSTSGWGNWGDGKFFSVGDFDGDGRQDWSWYAPWSNGFVVMYSNGAGSFTSLSADTSGLGNWSAAKYFRVGKFANSVGGADPRVDWSWYAPWTDNMIVFESRGRQTPVFDFHQTSTAGWGKF